MADVNLGVKIEADAQGILDLKQHLIDLKKHLVELRQQKLDIADKGRLADINDQIRRTAVEIQNTSVKIQELNYNLQKDMASALAQGGQAAHQMSMALQSLNFVIRDSPYFFRDFALGVLAIGNNLNPLIDSFIRAKQAADEQNISFMALMKQGLMGTSGIILGFSLLVSILQAVVFWKEKTKDKTEENTKALEREQKQLEKNIETFLKYKANLPAYKEGEELIKSVDEQIKKLEEQKKAIEKSIKAKQDELDTWLQVAIVTNTNTKDTKNQSNETQRLKSEIEDLNRQLDTQNSKLKELQLQKDNLIKQQIKYTELTELGNKVSKEGVKVIQDYIKQTKPLYAEYDLLVEYLTEQLKLSKDNSKEARNFALAIDFLKQKQNELTDAIKNSRKETQEWIKDLIKQDEEEYKKISKRDKEFVKHKEQELSAGKFTDYERDYQVELEEHEKRKTRLLNEFTKKLEKQPDTQLRYELTLEYLKKLKEEEDRFYRRAEPYFILVKGYRSPALKLIEEDSKKAKERGAEATKETEKELADLNAKQKQINETQKDRLELQQWELKNLKLQFNALGDIAMALDSITGKTNDWGRRIASILQYIIEIATAYEKMQTSQVSGTTGWLQILGSILGIGALLFKPKPFQTGGIIGGEGGRAVPIIAHEGEMVLNKQQQRNLFKMINYGFVAPSNSLNVRIDGSIKAKKSDFIVEFKRAEKLIYKSNL
jgi:hypothetical protein